MDRFFSFSLLGLVASGYLAVAGSGYLDLPTTLAAGLAIIVRALLEAWNREFPLGERWVNGLTLLYIGFYPLDYLFLSREFLPATVHLVLFLAIVKILTARTSRDHLFVVVIAFLELLAASLLSTQLNYFVFLALFLLFAVSTFASWEIRRAGRLGRAVLPRRWTISFRLAGLAVAVSLGILLFTAGLFFILPRTARAAFERLIPERYHITAFSNRVSLGDIGAVKQQSIPLMHVRIEGDEGTAQLKWRGNALAEFDGRQWFNASNGGQALRSQGGMLFLLASDDQRRRKGRRLSYEVQLKSLASETLFVAGRPEALRIDAPVVLRSAEDSYRANFRGRAVLRYGVYSYLDDPAAARDVAEPAGSLAAGARYLTLPPLDPRTGDLARRLTAGYSDPFERAQVIERHLRQSYAYAIDLPDEESADPIASFLFERRRGHCEYFASAMAVMLRTIGIPSRVAIGFQSGTYNPISGWYVIRSSDAHSWVEAWLPGRGWTTFDPTPPGPAPSELGLVARLALFFDAAETFWQEWVLEYDLNRQIFLASHMERSSRRFSFSWPSLTSRGWGDLRANVEHWFRTNGTALLAALAMMALAAPLAPRVRRWCLRRWRTRRLQQGRGAASDGTLVYLRALDLLASRGYQKPSWLTPGEFLRHVPEGPVADVFGRLTSAYQELRFGGRSEAAIPLASSLDELERALR